MASLILSSGKRTTAFLFWAKRTLLECPWATDHLVNGPRVSAQLDHAHAARPHRQPDPGRVAPPRHLQPRPRQQPVGRRPHRDTRRDRHPAVLAEIGRGDPLLWLRLP